MMRFNHKLLRLLPKTYEAVTLPWGIYFRKSEDETANRIIIHELCHKRQIERDGAIKFYFLYLYHYLKNLIKFKNHWEAYVHIPYEIEAYNEESNA